MAGVRCCQSPTDAVIISNAIDDQPPTDVAIINNAIDVHDAGAIA